MLEFWLDPESVYFKKGKLDMNKEMVLFCAGGLRSALAAKSLQDMGYKKVSHIEIKSNLFTTKKAYSLLHIVSRLSLSCPVTRIYKRGGKFV